MNGAIRGFLLGGLAAGAWMVAGAVEVDSGTAKAIFNGNGELERIVTAKGVDLLEMRMARPEPLWKIGLVRPDDFTAETNVTAAAAKCVTLTEAGVCLRQCDAEASARRLSGGRYLEEAGSGSGGAAARQGALTVFENV